MINTSERGEVIEMEEPKCKKCNRVLSGYYDFHRTFYKCQCGERYKGFNPAAQANNPLDV